MKTYLLPALLFVSAAIAGAQDSDIRSLLQKGDALDRKLQTKEALAVYLEADRIEPNNAEVLHRIAKEYGLSMGDATSSAEKKAFAQKSLDYAKFAVGADANNAKAHLALAIAYGRIAPLLDNKTKIAYSKKVKEEADKALALDPKDDLTYHVLGAWNYELANLGTVLKAIAQLVYGKLPAASNDEAARCFRKAIELAPTRLASHVELGRTFAAMDLTDQARDELNRGIALPSREKDDEESKERARAALKKL